MTTDSTKRAAYWVHSGIAISAPCAQRCDDRDRLPCTGTRVFRAGDAEVYSVCHEEVT